MTSQPLGGSSTSTSNSPMVPPSSLTQIPELQAIALNEQQKNWASHFNHKYSSMKNARAPFERQWYINLAFANGKHYVAPVEVPGQGFRLTSPRVPAHRVRLVINKVRTAVRVECSKLSSSRPIPTVMPKTSEDEDFNAAEIAEQLLKSRFATAEFNEKYRSWIWWGVITGTSFMKSYWDASAKDDEAQPEPVPMPGIDGQPLIDPASGQPVMAQQVVMGDIKIDRVSPWHVYVPDLLAESLEDQPYLMHVMTRTPLWVENAFGFKPTCDTNASSTIIDSAFLITKGSTESTLDSVLVKEVWIKPNGHRDFPDGGMLTIINDRCVQAIRQWPWPFKEFPFYKYSGIPTGGFYSDSVLVDLIPLQKEYNRTRSQMVEIKNTVGKPRMFYQQGSLDPRRIGSEPNQAIPYLAGYSPPVPMPAAEVPATMPMELDRLSSDFDDISGQHEISRGNTPAQVTSGTAISFLQEQDDTKLSYQVASIEYAIQTLGRHYLKLVAKYWETERLIKVVGKDNYVQSLLWKGNDLRGNTDVIVQTGSALPTSKAALQAMITEFMQNGWIDPATGMEILQLGAFTKALDELMVDKKQAFRENLKMSKLTSEDIQKASMQMDPNTGQAAVGPDGQPVIGKPQLLVPVNSWDDQEQHIHFHNQFRKTQEFELLDEEIKNQFEMHVQLHQYALMSVMVGANGPIPGSGQEAPVAVPQDAGGQSIPQ